ncbi:MAG: hypothetical protein RR533_07190, partial [Carnobacterium sp.]
GAYVQGPGGEEILLNPRLPGTDKTTTLIHELAHAKAHKNSTLSPGEKEFQAELTSYVVSKHYGIDTSEQAIPYIAKWTRNGEKVEDKVKLLEDVHTISREFIKVIDETIENEQSKEIDQQEKSVHPTELTRDKEKSIEVGTTEPSGRFFRIKFNETDPELGIKDYEGEIVTPDLIQEIKGLEGIVPENSGYYKFYFDEVVKGEVVDHRRMDVGDGLEANKEMYDYLSEGAITVEKEAINRIKLPEKIEDTQTADNQVIKEEDNEPNKQDQTTEQPKQVNEATPTPEIEKEPKEPAAAKPKTNKKFVSKEEIASAKQVDIVDYATSNGIPLIKDSERYYRWADHDSLVIDRKENFFNWNSQGIDGDSAQFAQTVGGIGSFPEAVQILNGGEYEVHSTESVPQEPYYYDS